MSDRPTVPYAHWGLPKAFVQIMIVYFAIVLTTSVGVSIISFVDALNRYNPPFVYPDPIEYPLQEQYCAGDNLEVYVTWKVRHGPVVNEVYESWYSYTDQFTVVPAIEPNYVVSVEGIGGEAHIIRQIPELSPGKYEYRRAIISEGRNAALVRVPFEVVDCK